MLAAVLALTGAGAGLGYQFLSADSPETAAATADGDRAARERAARAAASPSSAEPTPSEPAPSATATAPSATRSASPAATQPPPPPTTRAATPSPTRTISAIERMENEVTVLINQERAKAGCGAVRTEERLRTAARRHSADMAANGYFSHTGLDGSSPWDRAGRAGYTQAIAENIAYGYATAADVVRGWMNSDGHRANILNCSARAVGNGLAYSADGTAYWTQLFGSV